MPAITVELPTKEYRIVNGPPEKILMFEVFGEVERRAPPPYFTVLDDDGRAHEIYAHIHLACRDIANQHDFAKGSACYYLTGMKSTHLDFLKNNFSFAAIYSVPKRTGRWLVIPKGGEALYLPGQYAPDHLDRAELPAVPEALTPLQALRKAHRRNVRLVGKDGCDIARGHVNQLDDTTVIIDNALVTIEDIQEVVFTF